MIPARPTALALAACAAFAALPAAAQSNEELLKELRALRDRVTELENRLAAQPAPPADGQWGMSPEQAQELARTAMKTDALQDAQEMQGFKGLKISGQIDPTWIYNRRADDAGFVFLNGEDQRYSYDNSYFGMAVLDFLKETDGGTLWHLTLAPERGTGALTNAGSIVHEASVSIPLTDSQTRLWLGQIPDWSGYEATMPAENKLVTHNLLFDFMAPTAYTGAVLDLTRGKWQTRVGLANLNTPRQGSGNKSPVLIYRVDRELGETAGWGFAGVHGKGPNAADEGGPNTTLHLFGVDGWYTAGDLSLFGQVSYGQQKKAGIWQEDGLRDARWWGLSGTAAYLVTPQIEAVVRADYVRNTKNGGGLLGYSSDDPVNGIGRAPQSMGADGPLVTDDLSKGANRYALSVGANYRFDENTLFKVEYRFDGATRNVFFDEQDDEFRKTNQLFGASVVVSF